MQKLLLLPVLGSIACGGARGEDEEGVADCDANFPTEIDGSYLKYPVDTNGDCAADFWKFYELLDSEGEVVTELESLTQEQIFEYLEFKRVREKWLDLNFDGTVDMVRRYDAREQLIEQAMDADFDGTVDRTDYYEDGLLTSRASDEDGDGVADLTRYYRNGELHRTEVDSDGDGEPDEWRFYEEGEILRIGLDTTGDGDIDEWVRRPTTARPTGTNPAAPSPAAPATDAAEGEQADAPEEG